MSDGIKNEDVARQLRLGEDSHWEFKQIEFLKDRPIQPTRNNLADELGAFANGKGGVLLCGVTDDGQVQGMTQAQLNEMERLLFEICSDSISPAIDVKVRRFEVEGQALLAVDVSAGYALHESPGGVYRRVGSSKRKLAGDERLRLAQQRGQARFRWFDEQVVPNSGFRTLDKTLWKPLLSAEGAVNPEQALVKMGLLASDDKSVLRATIAGVLLCNAAPEDWLPNACITATCYRGKDRSTGQVDAQTIGGPLPRQIGTAVSFVMRNMRVAAHKIPARAELPQYSKIAIFEAVVNAVVHRDYSVRGSRIRLSMFEDRVEIQSPGTLPNNLTVDDMPYRAVTRNENLASLFGRVSAQGISGAGGRLFLMERRGDGIPIMRRETRDLTGKFPTFSLISDSELCVSIPAAQLDSHPSRITVSVLSNGVPLPEVDLLVMFPNNTWQRVDTDANGEAELTLYTSHLPMTVFVAAEGYAAHVEREWMPCNGKLLIDIEDLPQGGAIIFPEGHGILPGLAGSLNAIRDSYDRTYLYASDISINTGQPQPVFFLFGEDIRLTDACGVELLVRIMDISGKAALLEYRPIVAS